MPLRSNDKAPYAPPATVLDLINRYRDRGLSKPFTAEVLFKAQVSDSLIPRTLASLEGLDLIDEKGNPTEQLEVLRRAPNAEFQPRLAEIVQGVYAEVFQYANPATDTAHNIGDAFRSYNPAGQRRRMVTLFLGLCDAAGLIPDGAPAKPGTKPTRSTGLDTAARTNTPKKAKRFTPARVSTTPNGDSGTIPLELSGLFASLPPKGKGWTQETRDSFLKAFTVVLDFVVKIRESPSVDGADDDE